MGRNFSTIYNQPKCLDCLRRVKIEVLYCWDCERQFALKMTRTKARIDNSDRPSRIRQKELNKRSKAKKLAIKKNA